MFVELHKPDTEYYKDQTFIIDLNTVVIAKHDVNKGNNEDSYYIECIFAPAKGMYESFSVTEEDYKKIKNYLLGGVFEVESSISAYIDYERVGKPPIETYEEWLKRTMNIVKENGGDRPL